MNKEKCRVSIICVFNNQNQFENQLKASLALQDIDYELVAIDNSDYKFKSAAEALNYGSNIAKGDIFVYSHQDIYLKRHNELKLFADAIEKCDVGTIVGTQGVREPKKVYFSNITSGTAFNKEINAEYMESLYEVSCVDEGFFGMKRDTWNSLKFNEELCDNWHLYCVEMCLHTRRNGNKVYVFPSQLHHFSMGKISLGYMKNLKKLCSVYRKDFKYIWTTCYKVRTNWIYINTLYFIWCLNRKLRGKLQ